MAQVAQQFKYIIGVDTHAATHAYAVLASTTGAVVGQAQFPASPAGVKRAADWIARRAPEDRLIAVEGTGSYGASLTRELHRRGEQRHPTTTNCWVEGSRYRRLGDFDDPQRSTPLGQDRHHRDR